jgi:signal peptidase I
MNEENSPSSPADQPSALHRTSTLKAILKEVILFAVIAVGVVLPFRLYVAEPYIVDGKSMDPTFATGDYLIVDKLSYELGAPKRDTVIVFKFPQQPSRNLIKRVIGLPGDTVTSNAGVVTIVNNDNPKGFILDQSYLKHPFADSFSITLGPDEYFVMGDNRPDSYDSRAWGILPKKDILGRPILRLLPIGKIGTLPGDDSKAGSK